MDEYKTNFDFEEDLLKEWKKPEIYCGHSESTFQKFKYLIISVISVIIIVALLILNLRYDNFKTAIYLLLSLIILSLLATVYINTDINKKLEDHRNLETLSEYLRDNNIKTVDDYTKLIERLESKKKKIVDVKLIDDFSSKAMLGVVSFFIGGILKETLFGKNISQNAINIESYIINAFIAIFFVCLLKVIYESINSALNLDKQNITLLIDDLERIKYTIEKEETKVIEFEDEKVNLKENVIDYIDNIDDAISKLEEVYFRLKKTNKKVERLFSSEINNYKDDDLISFKQTLYKETNIKRKN